ncbi:adenylate cyclase [Lysobacter sp. TY2-98]|uniref:tetratricopeptide repeat protein n=1 Tax=Lysobacter sp. TY2-98 TaxID=2290922 RepID=UPI000E20522E|nr:tetratricopeptide repeat protein [Lysobacter sp. TY2-98]AXK73308.1 adenylate cyclase [Lysobacter sp. TY2-98]
MYDTVIDALRRGAAGEALAAAQTLADQQPDDLRTLRLLAAAQRLAGDNAAAMATLDRSLQLEPENADLHLERAGLLLQSRDLSGAETALAKSVGLDPNQFPAYIIQAQLAVGRGDLDEAERLVRTAARIAPEHPYVAAVEGVVALRRGRADEALDVLSRASQMAPDEPMLRNSLGFAYLAKGHLAFAEQAFRGVLQSTPDNVALRALIADIVRQQGRPGEAAEELQPLLDDDTMSPALHRLVGELEIEADRLDSALPRLKHALARMPGDRRTLSALLTAWQLREDRDDARNTLDAALATHAQEHDLWLARLGAEAFGSDEARAVIDRWLAAMPDDVPALLARMSLHDLRGESELAEAAAQRVADLEPGHTQAEMRLLDGLMTRDPEQAVTRLRSLIERVSDPQVARGLRQLLGFALDRAGRPADAASTWLALQQEIVDERLPLPSATGFVGPWPELAPLPDNAPGVLLMWGAPGAMVERLVRTFELGGAPMLTDRFGPQPPNDPFQRFDTAHALVAKQIDGAYLASQWRAGLPARGIADRNVFDWLLHWDNALLLALRPYMPEAMLMVALRDPRDMLMDWLAFGGALPLRFESPLAAASWLAGVLSQIADLHEQDLFPHRLVRLDGIENDPAGVAQALAESMQIEVPVPPLTSFGPGRLPSGHWQRFAGVFDDAFAVLGPVAARLGYTA